MISLASPTDKLLRAQIGEAVGVIAAIDFPAKRWPDLIQVSRINPETRSLYQTYVIFAL